MQHTNEDYDSTLMAAPSFKGKSFNKRLDPTQLDVHEHDTSCCATVTRTITGIVSRLLRPRQVVVILRLLKALTFCILCLTIIADLIFVFYVSINLSNDVSTKLGGNRDRIMRVYGIAVGIIAVLVELDMQVITSHFGGLKPFLVRSTLLLYVATVSGTSPMIRYEAKQARNNRYSYDDDGGDDDGNGNNNGNQYNYNYNQSHYIRDEVPGSIIAFQSMTSFFLFCCACAYFTLGLLCLDIFTARAFLADDDQVAAAVNATALRGPGQGHGHNASGQQSEYDSYDESDPERDNYATNNGTYSPNRPYH